MTLVLEKSRAVADAPEIVVILAHKLHVVLDSIVLSSSDLGNMYMSDNMMVYSMSLDSMTFGNIAVAHDNS